MNISDYKSTESFPENIRSSFKNIWDKFNIGWSLHSTSLYYDYAKDPTAYRAKYDKVMKIYNAIKSNKTLNRD